MSVQQEKFKAIADKIRLYLMTDEPIKPNDFANKVSDVYYRGDEDGYIQGVYAGIDEGIRQGREEAVAEKLSLSISLSEALTSGSENVILLETNINQAKSDITAIKALIENHGVEVPVGTLSSTYDETIEQIITDEKATGIEQGKQAQNDEFWVDYISTMNSTWNSSYSIAGFGWNDKTFKPTRNLTVYQATNMFASCRITDLADILEKQGVTWSFSSCTNLNSLANYSTITRFPLLDTRSCSSLHGAFDNCTSLHTVVKIILKNDGTQTLTNTFVNCTHLANIIFEGVIGQNLDMKSSPLTKESIENVIGCLSTTTTGKTLTLNKTAKEAAFTDEEWATLTATKPNWTISLV